MIDHRDPIIVLFSVGEFEGRRATQAAGRGPRKKDLDGTGGTPFVTSSDSNNGWTSFTSFEPIHDANTIGVNRNGSVAEAFYQPSAFCSTEDVHIFKPKFTMNKYIGLFLY